MFENAPRRAAAAAAERAAARRSELAERLAAELPPGIAATIDGDNVRLAGRGLARRFALDARLRRKIEELVR